MFGLSLLLTKRDGGASVRQRLMVEHLWTSASRFIWAMIYGNVGVPERLQFTVVGSVVNEVVRVQDLTKQLGHPLLVTGAFAAAVNSPWRSVGKHALRGLENPIPDFALGEQQQSGE